MTRLSSFTKPVTAGEIRLRWLAVGLRAYSMTTTAWPRMLGSSPDWYWPCAYATRVPLAE